MGPRVSVLTTLFNSHRFTGEAVGKVLGRSLRDLAVVACHDGSTDGSAEAVAVPPQAQWNSAMQRRLETGVEAMPSGAPDADFPAGARPLLRDADVFQKLRVARLPAERDQRRGRAEASHGRKKAP